MNTAVFTAVVAQIVIHLGFTPFFAGGTGGWDKATGATAGYFVGFIVASGIVGWCPDRRQDRALLGVLGSVALGLTTRDLNGSEWCHDQRPCQNFSWW